VEEALSLGFQLTDPSLTTLKQIFEEGQAWNQEARNLSEQEISTYDSFKLPSPASNFFFPSFLLSFFTCLAFLFPFFLAEGEKITLSLIQRARGEIQRKGSRHRFGEFAHQANKLG